jgi:hypothetical protein
MPLCSVLKAVVLPLMKKRDRGYLSAPALSYLPEHSLGVIVLLISLYR